MLEVKVCVSGRGDTAMEVYKHPRPESDSACACVCACHQHTLHKLNTEVIAASFLVT